jgi:hypothetical protein
VNEVLTLRFVDYEPALAEWMLGCGRTFASSKPDGRPGERHGALFHWGSHHCIAFWTKARTVVVRELPKNGAQP